jgi:hypothetical protein
LTTFVFLSFMEFISNRLVAGIVLLVPGVYLLVIPALTDSLGLNPLQGLLHRSGEIAIWTLGAVLCLSHSRLPSHAA